MCIALTRLDNQILFVVMSNERDALKARILPQMILSEGSNPLTAPVPQDNSLSPAQRAQQRFTIRGNAVVTGGAGVLGLEAACGLLEHGAKAVCLFDLAFVLESAKDKIEALRAEFPDAKIITKPVDITDEESVKDAVKGTAEALGSIEILLCFAGVVGAAHAEEITLQEWKRLLDINTTGTWICAQTAGKQMIAQQTGGSIVLTASISAQRVNFPQPQVSYNASKGALLQLSRYMDTILNEGPGLEVGRNIWTSRNPMGRMGNPKELVGAVVYMNGADIVVDGGSSVF
ncbi:hypothetical protein BDQ17DRAFT_1347436 [Cyathus striatus]|nr:hypothetical protein BDQ17DRAFT_1347436 [Cyathus striatus]